VLPKSLFGNPHLFFAVNGPITLAGITKLFEEFLKDPMQMVLGDAGPALVSSSRRRPVT
jgi:hypothetical protein